MARLTSLGQHIDALIDARLTPEAQSRAAAGFARRILMGAQAEGQRVLGYVPPHTTIVDGRREAPLEAVKPDGGRITFEFQLVSGIVEWIRDQLRIHSPVGKEPDRRPGHPGLYRSSHLLFVDGSEVDPDGQLPPGREYVFVSTVPYARRLERHYATQGGIYEAVAALADRRFGNMASVRFTFRAMASVEPGLISKAKRQAERDARHPAIIIRPRG